MLVADASCAQDPARHARYQLFRAVRLIAPNFTPFFNLKLVHRRLQQRWCGAQAPVDVLTDVPLHNQQDSDCNAGRARNVCESVARLDEEGAGACCCNEREPFQQNGNLSGIHDSGYEGSCHNTCGLGTGTMHVTSVEAFSDDHGGNDRPCGGDRPCRQDKSCAVREAWTPELTIREQDGLVESRMAVADLNEETVVPIPAFVTVEITSTVTDDKDNAEDRLSGTTTVSPSEALDNAGDAELERPTLSAAARRLAMHEVYLQCTLQVLLVCWFNIRTANQRHAMLVRHNLR